jgi:hypothetical protein
MLYSQSNTSVSTSVAFNIHDATRELMDRSYNNNIYRLDWPLIKRIKTLFVTYCKTPEQKEKFAKVFLPSMQYRLKEITSKQAKVKFVRALWDELETYPELFSELVILQATAWNSAESKN